MVGLWVEVTLSGWSPAIWILVKKDSGSLKLRGEGSIKDIKPYEARTPTTLQNLL
jgi:hypothetical protein